MLSSNNKQQQHKKTATATATATADSGHHNSKMSSNKKTRLPIEDSPRKSRQQRRKEEKETALLEAAENVSLVERILPIVFSSGVLIRFE